MNQQQELKTNPIVHTEVEGDLTYCNICGEYRYIVKYDDELDVAYCGRCVDDHRAIKNYFKRRLDVLIESVSQ